MSSWLDKFYDKKVKGFQLMITHDKFYKLYAKDNETNEVIFLKNFVSKEDYSRFLMEAVIMRLSSKHEGIQKARSIWKNMLAYLRDNKRKISTFLFCLFFSFGLSGCSSFDGEVLHTKSEITTIKGELYSCEYTRGSLLNCKKEIKNEL